MTYLEALETIHDFGRFGSKLGLSRMSKLMSLLDNPQDQVKVIHVAGTNGKGSVCRYIYSILMAGGYKVGLYTSPYLEKFTERMELDGYEIPEPEVAVYAQKVLEKVNSMVAEGFESPTEFEVITAMAFCYYADEQVDFLVLEVGLGGTGDSTNIIKTPEVCIITSISYDHMDYLGESLEEIASEKAGIIKIEVPVVVFVRDESAKGVIKSAALSKNSSFYDATIYPVSNLSESLTESIFDVMIEEKLYSDVKISMIGVHQVDNAVCALTAIQILQSKKTITLNDQQVYNGLVNARQTGRLEILGVNPYIVIDGAHNEAGASALAKVIKTHFAGKRILLILGMLKDKKIDRILTELLALTDDIVATEPDNSRKLEAIKLAEFIAIRGKECFVMPDIKDAVSYALKHKENFDLVIFAGSLYLIGKVRGMIHETT